MADATGFHCEVTGFRGFENEILRLRNANRERAESLEYLRWRYQFLPDMPEPRIFWLLRSNGERVGMAAVIFRPYLMGGVRVPTAVVGDISLDAQWRGRGLGRLLLGYMTNYLTENFSRQPAFVIPTESARRTLDSVGWVTRGRLVPYVCVLDAARHLQAAMRSAWLARRAAAFLAAGGRLIARARAPRNGALFVTDAPETASLEFVNLAPVSPSAIHDLGSESLLWRYGCHPHTKFLFGRYCDSGVMRGLVVFEDDVVTHTCSIYDLVSTAAADARSMLALVVLRAFSSAMSSVRIVLGDRHPLRSCLRGLGFIPRRADSVFQVHSGDGMAERMNWWITHGDKDT